MEVSIVVVFDDDGVVVFCPMKESNAADRRGKNRAGRELMRRRDKDGARILWNRSRIQTGEVDCDGMKPGTGGAKNVAGEADARLDGDKLIAVEGAVPAGGDELVIRNDQRGLRLQRRGGDRVEVSAEATEAN